MQLPGPASRCLRGFQLSLSGLKKYLHNYDRTGWCGSLEQVPRSATAQIYVTIWWKLQSPYFFRYLDCWNTLPEECKTVGFVDVIKREINLFDLSKYLNGVLLILKTYMLYANMTITITNLAKPSRPSGGSYQYLCLTVAHVHLSAFSKISNSPWLWSLGHKYCNGTTILQHCPKLY